MSPKSSDDVEAALQQPLQPVVRMEAGKLRGSMTVPDFQGKPFRDLQTRRVAGVEALLCVPGTGTHEFRPAIELAAEIDSAGFGLALVERRLHDACREQRAWLRRVEHEFPIAVLHHNNADTTILRPLNNGGVRLAQDSG